MTLCTAWIRQADGQEELIFATDSCLSGGERWNSGVKLFELPRKDCLICFAGETTRTYPLILNLISSIKFDEDLFSPHTDITDILEYLIDLFSNLCNSIKEFNPLSFEDALGDFEFMFGGWSWKENRFIVWKLKYNHEVKFFLHNRISEDNMFFTFIGDEINRAEELLTQEIANNGKILSRNFDMEPFRVLLQMIRNKEYDSIDGAIQLAKIHPPGATEFYGVYWPSIAGRKTFLGKDVSFENNPSVKFIDPDTCEIIGEELPQSITEPTEEEYGVNYEFIKDLYSADGYRLKNNITKKQKMILSRIFKEVAYKQFIEKQTAQHIDSEEL